MSVLVKGMKIPKNCNGCDFMCCLRHFNILNDDRPSDCPIIAELPEKHGRLKDVDELIEFIENRYDITWESDCYEGGIKDACTDIIEKINSMPTIIGAEGAKK